MPLVDIYASAGRFTDPHRLALDAANTVREVEQTPDIPMFRKNTAAFVHELPSNSISNCDGEGDYVRVQVTTNTGALDRDKQIAIVNRLTSLICRAGNDRGLARRTWVVLSEATSGGWGLWGHAYTNEQLVEAAKHEIATLRQPIPGS